MPSCCVVGCKSHSSKSKIEKTKFHRIPVKRRKLWEKIINRQNWKVGRDDKICSKHFVSGYPGWDKHDVDWVPTLYMKPTVIETIISKPLPIEKERSSLIAEEINETEPSSFAEEVFPLNLSREERQVRRNAKKRKSDEDQWEKNWYNYSIQSSLSFHDYTDGNPSKPKQSKTTRSFGTQTMSDHLLEENAKLKLQIEEYKDVIRKKTWSFEKIQHDDSVTKFYTGLPTFATFMWLFNFLRRKAECMTYYRASKSADGERKNVGYHKLSLINEFFAVLMRLKLGLLTQDIADRFDISISTFSEIFTTWICLLDKELQALCPYPSKELVNKYMPEKFKKYPDTMLILDATEVFIERSKDMLTQNTTYSSYKHHNTAKFLIGITPGGVISYVSKPWGGRASDKYMVEKSGIIDLIPSNSNVMADKGFTIQDLLAPKQCTLNIPPFLKSKAQFTEEEVVETRRIAELRIHVERAIGRIKNFHILDGVFPISQIKIISQIFSVCSNLTNINKPVVGK